MRFNLSPLSVSHKANKSLKKLQMSESQELAHAYVTSFLPKLNSLRQLVIDMSICAGQIIDKDTLLSFARSELLIKHKAHFSCVSILK